MDLINCTNSCRKKEGGTEVTPNSLDPDVEDNHPQKCN